MAFPRDPALSRDAHSFRSRAWSNRSCASCPLRQDQRGAQVNRHKIVCLSIGFVAAITLSAACASTGTMAGPVCETVIDYRLGSAVADSGTHGFGVNISGYPLDDCDVKFVSGANVAEYVVHPFPWDAATPYFPGPPVAHLPDSQVCGSFSPLDDCGLVVVSGPAPPSKCRRSGDCLDMSFGAAMRDYLGSSTYEVQVTCAKDLLVQTRGLDSNTQHCAL